MIMRALALSVLVLFPATAAIAQQDSGGASDALAALTQAERAAIISQGPWPMDWKPDPSNRVSGDPAAARLGFRLFFDARLSEGAVMSCATCHRPENGFAEARAVSQGRVPLTRNAPGLNNVRFNRWFGHDGGTDSLWASSIRTFLKKEEFASGPQLIENLLAGDDALRREFEAVFGTDKALQKGEAAMVLTAKALAAFQETLVSARTPFDDFRDAIAIGDDAAAALYPAAATRGAKLFFGRGQCHLCHFGPTFSNREFGDVGRPLFVPGGVDKGRYDGIRAVKASRFNLLGAFSDDPRRSTAGKTRYLDLKPRNWGEFAVPGLRGVAQTAPYMHDGSLATLSDVVRHYSELDPDRIHADANAILKPLRLTEPEIADLVAFLESL
jgi:cytochrome c peroxidase